MESLKYDAFISYSRADYDEVMEILNRLKNEVPDFRFWFDITGIESGDEFCSNIIKAIDESDRLFFMVSDNSIKSAWTKKEVTYAQNRQKRIIPILLKGAKLKDWFLFQFGNIDCIDSQNERHIQKLISNLHSWCEKNDSSRMPLLKEVSSQEPLLKEVSSQDHLVKEVSPQDPLLKEIAEYCSQRDRISSTDIQRRFCIGYNRTQRILSQLRDSGMIAFTASVLGGPVLGPLAKFLGEKK